MAVSNDGPSYQESTEESQNIALRDRSKMTPDEVVNHNMTNYPPVNQSVIHRFEELRAAAKNLGYIINFVCPDSREKSLAMTNLEQTLMWAISSVARNQIITQNCPMDTNGDGDCGRQLCPYCGEGRSVDG